MSTAGSPGEQAAVRRFVERIASTYGTATVLWVPDGDVRALTPADVVVAFEVVPGGAPAGSWEGHAAALASLARKALVVVLRNPERVVPSALPRGEREGRATLTVAPALWAAGRVREHAYLMVPAAIGRVAGPSASTAPGEVQAPAGWLVRRTARLHAFVVDTAPRTPQARLRRRGLLGPPAM